MAFDSQSGWIPHLGEWGLGRLLSATWARMPGVSTAGLASPKLYFTHNRRNVGSCLGAESYGSAIWKRRTVQLSGKQSHTGCLYSEKIPMIPGSVSARPTFWILFFTDCVGRGRGWLEGRELLLIEHQLPWAKCYTFRPGSAWPHDHCIRFAVFIRFRKEPWLQGSPLREALHLVHSQAPLCLLWYFSAKVLATGMTGS